MRYKKKYLCKCGEQTASQLSPKRLPFGPGAGEPLAETPLHGLPAVPAAHVDRGDDLERLEPLDEALQLQEAAVLAVWDSCEEREKRTFFSGLSFLIFLNHWNLLDVAFSVF